MGLLDRRIALLFAAFLGLLTFAAVRAAVTTRAERATGLAARLRAARA